jgi:hypothetical protein
MVHMMERVRAAIPSQPVGYVTDDFGKSLPISIQPRAGITADCGVTCAEWAWDDQIEATSETGPPSRNLEPLFY